MRQKTKFTYNRPRPQEQDFIATFTEHVYSVLQFAEGADVD